MAFAATHHHRRGNCDHSRGRGLPHFVVGVDVVRCGAAADLYTNQGLAVTVEAVAQIKVKSDECLHPHRCRAVPVEVGKKTAGIDRLVMEGHLRGSSGSSRSRDLKEPEMVADRMRSTCADDMNKMGLEVVSFTIKEVRDKNEYIANMGRPGRGAHQA